MRTIAVVLAGAVAKGAFEAGALQVLAESGARVVRIVAASSGALNGVAYATAVRARRERDGAAELAELWRDKATWMDIFHLDWGGLIHRKALSNLERVRGVLKAGVLPAQAADPAEINLRLVLGALDGVAGTIGDHAATTYERMVEFDGPAFDTAAALDRVFTAVLASSSLPFLFAPTLVDGVGPCIDGGAVNNTPVGYALGDATGQTLDAVVVICPTVEEVRAPAGDLNGVDYIGHLVEVLINERLYRDLHEAEARNAAIRALDEVTLPAAARLAVLRALGWEGVRAVEIVQIRPLEALPGTAFSALRDAGQRDAYIATGAARARAVLGALGWV